MGYSKLTIFLGTVQPNSHQCYLSVALVAMVLMAIQLLLRYIINYDIKNGHFRIILLGCFVGAEIPLSEIKSVKVWDIFDANISLPLLYTSYGNRLLVRRTVLLEKKAGLVRWLFISPDNPESFAHELRQSLESQL